MSFRKKERRLGSAQVGSWRFTYEDRIHSFAGVDCEAGLSALSAYAAFFGKLERRLFSRFCAGVPVRSLKKDYVSRYRIPARMFNSLGVSVEGLC